MILIKVPKKAKILILEDSQERIKWFKDRVPWAQYTASAGEAISWLEKERFDIAFLDHDLGGLVVYKDRVEILQPKEETGLHVAEFMAARGFMDIKVIIHSWNPSGVKNMLAALRYANAIAFGQFEILVID